MSNALTITNATGQSAERRGSQHQIVAKTLAFIQERRAAVHFRLALATLAIKALPVRLIPFGVPMTYRLAGFRGINPRVAIDSTIDFHGSGDLASRLSVGEGAYINRACRIELNAPVQIGRHVGLGNDVVLITSTHELGNAGHRWGALRSAPITIGDGSWIGARVTILPGVTIGPGSVVGAGSVVIRDIPTNVMAAGNPARIVKELPPGEIRAAIPISMSAEED